MSTDSRQLPTTWRQLLRYASPSLTHTIVNLLYFPLYTMLLMRSSDFSSSISIHIFFCALDLPLNPWACAPTLLSHSNKTSRSPSIFSFSCDFFIQHSQCFIISFLARRSCSVDGSGRDKMSRVDFSIMAYSPEYLISYREVL